MLTYNVLNDYVERLKKQDLPVVAQTDNITTLTTEDINKLRAGDIVTKITGNQKHTYIVSYKENNKGICLTYTDASVVETVSYDYNSTTKEWTYNSTDIMPIQHSLTAGSNITINNNVISATDTTYTAGTGISITDGVISAVGGSKIYEHNLHVTYMGSQDSSYIYLTIINSDSSAYTKDSSKNDLANWLYTNGYTSKDKAHSCSGTYYINSEGVERPVLSIFSPNQTTFTVVDIKSSDNTEKTANFSGLGLNAGLEDYVRQL